MSSPWIREEIVPPGAASLLTMNEKLIDQLWSIDLTALPLLVSAWVRAVASSVSWPLIELCDGAPVPDAAPVLTPMSSMLVMLPVRPPRVASICSRMVESSCWRSESPNSVPCVGSLLEGAWVSWVWIRVIAEL